MPTSEGLNSSKKSLKRGRSSPRRRGDGECSRKQRMARCAPGHFSIHPEDLDGREMVTTVRTATDGELNVEFKATIHMEMSAFQKLAEKKFKGVYWLNDKPVDVEG